MVPGTTAVEDGRDNHGATHIRPLDQSGTIVSSSLDACIGAFLRVQTC
jgi:hypothetical protein